jgi:hypothetical protein
MNREIFINYMNFIRKVGRPMSEFYEGSNEFALKTEDALSAINILRGSQLPIVGGDIVSEDSEGKLIYAIYLWGYEYVYLNWYYEEENQKDEYIEKSYQLAQEKIIAANNTAKHLVKSCYIIIIV